MMVIVKPAQYNEFRNVGIDAPTSVASMTERKIDRIRDTPKMPVLRRLVKYESGERRKASTNNSPKPGSTA